MTGRRLYDLYCDARRRGPISSFGHTTFKAETPVAWPFLGSTEQRVWTGIAKRLKGVRR